MTYYRQLDSLRCIAVFIVIFHHLPVLKNTGLLGFCFQNITGVDLFFVLSGFLIINILITTKNKGVRMGSALKTFYIRRFFRIFPIYYLTILFLVIVNPANYRDYFVYDLFYISNIKMGLDGSFSTVTPHFWSLAVEEQFYLIVPLIIFITPARRLIHAIFALALVGFISYFVLYNTEYRFFSSRTLVPLLYLGSGGVLAYAFIYYRKIFEFLSNSMLFVLLVYIVLMSLAYTDVIVVGSHAMFFLKFMFCVLTVAKFTIGFSGAFGKVFGSRILIYLGKISYGLYLYHFLMVIPLAFINRLALRWGYDLMADLYIANLFKIILTVLVAALSWRLIEVPISKLKEKFSYR